MSNDDSTTSTPTLTRKRGRPTKSESGRKSQSISRQGQLNRRTYKTDKMKVARQRREGTGAFRELFEQSLCERSDVGGLSAECEKCGAFNYPSEWIGPQSSGHFSICCFNGQIVMPPSRQLKTPPQFLVGLFADNDDRSKHFREFIRQINSALAFASLRVNIDTSVLGGGPYVFKVQGIVYHSIGPSENSYCKLYMVDCDEAMDLRYLRKENKLINKQVLLRLDKYIRENNPLAKLFRKMNDIFEVESQKAKDNNQPIPDIRLAFNKDSSKDQRRYNLPQADEIAAIWVGQDGEPNFDIDFTVAPYGERLTRIPVTSSKIDPMVYPLFHIHGEEGWDPSMKRNSGGERTRITMREFYCFRFAKRKDFNVFHHGGKLFQQFAVDVCVRDENNKLNYIRNQQSDLRSESFDGCIDYVNAADIGKHGADEPEGRAVILPATFTGSPRNMYQNYQDAMAIVRDKGKPTFFITMTANPNWPEVKKELFAGQTSSDRFDLVTRVFHLKLQQLMDDLTNKHVLGVPVGYTYSIEFQKRGLPHVHILMIMRLQDRPRDASDIDHVICAELPNPDKSPELYNIITTCMLHGPCGSENPKAVCMVNGSCSKDYPKDFLEETNVGVDSFSVYRRRNNGRVIVKNVRNVGKVILDNRNVVPYNPFLSYKYNCHINVEHCASIKAVKYLYMYITKGPDRATVEISSEGSRDEIKEYLDARYLGPQEACWKLFSFEMSKRSHAVERLAIHLPRKHFMTFKKGKLKDMNMALAAKTTLTEYFAMNKENFEVDGKCIRNEDCSFVNSLLYQDMPYHFTFNKSTKRWNRRKNECKIISRMYNVSVKDRERFFLRMLLLNIKGATSFEQLRTVCDVEYDTFEDAAIASNFISNDEETEDCMAEAVLNLMAPQLRTMFALLCAMTDIGKPLQLFNNYKHNMMEDFLRSMTEVEALNKLLQTLDEIFRTSGTSCDQMGLPQPQYIAEIVNFNTNEMFTRDSLNRGQKLVFDEIMAAIDDKTKPRFYFINAHGGTGKTFLFSVLISELKRMKRISLPVAFSGIAATLLEDGRTVHSRFKLPVPLLDTSVSYHRMQSKEADFIRRASLIIWDEAPMAPALALNCVDRLLRQIMVHPNTLFGGKVVVMGGDFRQILPVVQGGGRVDIVNSCIKRSKQWREVKQMSLTENMRAEKDEVDFAEWLLKLGDGTLPTIPIVSPFAVEIPNDMMVNNNIEDEIFGEKIKITEIANFTSTVILCPTNDDTFEMNQKVLNKLEGDSKTYLSLDEIECDKAEEVDHFPLEFIHKQTPAGLPPHELTLKKGAIVMLIKNINPNKRLCNGTRLVVTELHENYIVARIINSVHEERESIVALPRMTLSPTDTGLPFRLKRKQLPIRLSFAMTINKAQGQTFDKVGLYLPTPVFSHGQLYVSFSRVRRAKHVKVQIIDTDIQGKFPRRKHFVTSNVVWPEVLDIPKDNTSKPTYISSSSSDTEAELDDVTPVPSPKRALKQQAFFPETTSTGLTQTLASINIVTNSRVVALNQTIAAQIFPLEFPPNSVTLDELKILAGFAAERMVSDEIVNAFLTLLCDDTSSYTAVSIPSTLFTLALDGQFEGYSDQELVSADIIFQPIVHNAHWILAVFEKRSKIITIYDSTNRDSNENFATMFKDLLTPLRIRVRDIKCRNTDLIVPNQSNGYDCGIFLMIFAYCIMNNIDLNTIDLSESEISNFRLKIAQSLLNKRVELH